MWIRVYDDLINLTTVRFIGISNGPQDKHVLYFIHEGTTETTTHIPFDTREEAEQTLTQIADLVGVHIIHGSLVHGS